MPATVSFWLVTLLGGLPLLAQASEHTRRCKGALFFACLGLNLPGTGNVAGIAATTWSSFFAPSPAAPDQIRTSSLGMSTDYQIFSQQLRNLTNLNLTSGILLVFAGPRAVL